MATRPNLLFIFTDEQRFDTLRCYGNDFVRAPNLNALAEESFVFQHPYVTQPVCTPARSTIMTGLYPHTTGCIGNNIPLRAETVTLAEMVSQDYRRTYCGKWHLGDEVIAQHGFEEWIGTEDNYRDHYSREEYFAQLSPYHHFLIENGFIPDKESKGAKVFSRPAAARLPEDYTKAAFQGREAARFIRENAGDPFVLYVNFLEPHMPFTGPFDDMYSPEEIPTGPHFMQKPPPNASAKNRRQAERFMQMEDYEGHNLTTEAGWRKLRAQYLGLVTLVDNAVGNILRALDESGVADNTLVVFTSDHGDMMGDHGQLTKGVLYEESVKVPLLIRIPWLGKQQREVVGRFSQIDLAPTLLDLLGEPIPETLQGESRVPVLRGEETLERNDAFVEWNAADDPWRTVVSAEGWKLNLSPEDQCELFDLNADPHEQQNRFDDPDQKDRIRDLAARIRRWQERTEDEAPLPAV